MENPIFEEPVDPAAQDPLVPDPNAVPPPAAAPTAEQYADLQRQLAQARDFESLADKLATRFERNAVQAPLQNQPAPQKLVDPLTQLTPEQRQVINQQFITDPIAAQQMVDQIRAPYQRAVLLQEAAPLIQNSAQGVVNAFKNGKASTDKLYAHVAPLFDQMIAQAGDIRGLITMTPQAQEYELGLRWKAARADVLEKTMAAPPPQSEPKLQSSASLGGGGNSLKKSKIDEHPDLMAMSKAYNFTPEQIKELEAYV